jgi:hypothetical protein
MIVALTAYLVAFEPLCASVNADGSVFDDGCGTCNETTAARWSPAAVSFKFDRNTVPSSQGVSTAQFASDISAVIAAWNAVPNSTMTVSDGGNATQRIWSNSVSDGEHDVFWTVDDNEWTNDTGFAPNGGALGVTTHGYSCSGGSGGRTSYSDADVILNGTPGLTALFSQYDGVCGGRPCPSSQTVLMHEIGHALGLGHPCAACSDALMVAKIAVNEPEPLPDDEVSLLGLYGAARSLGEGCAGGGDCSSSTCGSFESTLSYCTQSCGSCPSGFACDGNNQCEFASFVDVALPGVGQPCDFSCANDCFAFGGPGSLQPGCNACLELNNNPAACVAGCSKSTGAGCDSNSFCSGVGTPDDQGQCKAKRGVGGQCLNDSFCVAGLACTNNICTGTPTGEGEGASAGEGEGAASSGEGEGAASSGEGEGEGAARGGEGEGEGEGQAAPKCACSASSSSTGAPPEVALAIGAVSVMFVRRRCTRCTATTRRA